MFSSLGKNISTLTRMCPLCHYGQASALGLCRVCFNDLPRCPPVDLTVHMAQAPKGVRLILASLWYMAEVRYWLAAFKFRGRSGEANAMATLICAQAVQHYRQQQLKLPNYLLPVPMTKKAWAARGYNQAQLLAEAVSELLGIPVWYGVVRTKQNIKAHKLGAKARRQVLNESFRQVGKLPRGTRIALIDDVLTTGATLGAIASILPRAGIIVDAWTLAYTPPPMLNKERY
ncbi:ComF family protein [Aliidiomarina quisquiliarum]|uniref:ComF family protein n=1 Tax=Aliidiomarina quisquiliarum TaxID=2938947 RepID=UPI00208E33CB|nr:hypothetical protein [Aliidiomarina quisquiliarum]MCO4322213.1 hypothetical protein [Aliidiomarina quisquiliarum]